MNLPFSNWTRAQISLKSSYFHKSPVGEIPVILALNPRQFGVQREFPHAALQSPALFARSVHCFTIKFIPGSYLH